MSIIRNTKRLIAGSIYRTLFLGIVIANSFGSPFASQLQADQPIPKKFHVWGAFSEGAWVKSKSITRKRDEKGTETDTLSDRKATLHSSRPDKFTLLIETSSDVRGTVRIENSEYLDRNWLPDTSAFFSGAPKGTDAKLQIDGKEFVCKVLEYQYEEKGQKWRRLDYVNEATYPFILRREYYRAAAPGEESEKRVTLMEVVATGMPAQVGDVLVHCVHIQTTTRSENGQILIIEKTSAEVPGGVIEQSVRELDAQGKMVREESVVITDFGVRNGESEPLNRFRVRRNRRQVDDSNGF